MATPSTLAERLVQARSRTSYGQDAVARLVGLSQPSYSALETGKSKATTKIGSLAHVLGVDAYWLETGQGGAERFVVREPSAQYGSPPSSEEAQLIDWYRGLSTAKRRAVRTLLQDRE